MFSNSSKSFLSSLSVCLWVLLGFFAAQFCIAYTIRLLVGAGLLQASDLEKPLTQLFLLAAAYSLTLLAVVMLPRLFSREPKDGLKNELGISKKPRPQDAGLSLLGYVAYLVLTISFTFLIQAIWREFNADQAQPVGFQELSNTYEYMLAFLALAIIAPFVEELLFRGYLFGKLRAQLGFWITTLITSALFGFVHLQWNVSIDVFALSLVLCYLREKTEAVWAGIVLHMIKNSIAFVLLFLFPDLLSNLV